MASKQIFQGKSVYSPHSYLAGNGEAPSRSPQRGGILWADKPGEHVGMVCEKIQAEFIFIFLKKVLIPSATPHRAPRRGEEVAPADSFFPANANNRMLVRLVELYGIRIH